MDVADPLTLPHLCRDGSPCSQVSQWYGEDPIGSAPSVGHLMFMELPLPWGADASASPRFPRSIPPLLKESARLGRVTRLQFIAPDPDHTRPGWTRLLLFHRPEGPFAHFESEEHLVPTDELPSFLETLLLDPHQMPGFERYRQPREGMRDLFVCTNSARDACCGSFGFPIYGQLRKQATESVRVWQTNHLGGHRLAPTLAEFPSGRYWGHLTALAAEILLHGSGPMESIKQCYRGWSGLKSEWEQVAERELFAREGWAWAGYEKESRLLSAEETSATVEITYRDPDSGKAGAYEARVEVAGIVPTLGSCGGEKLTKSRLYRVTRLESMPVQDPEQLWCLESLKL